MSTIHATAKSLYAFARRLASDERGEDYGKTSNATGAACALVLTGFGAVCAGNALTSAQTSHASATDSLGGKLAGDTGGKGGTTPVAKNPLTGQ